MVKIQVLGQGMIPGIGTVAPHKSPFEADYKLITRIMGHGSLQVKIQNPITKAFIPVTSSNAKRMYETWNDYKVPETTTSTPVLHPLTPQPTPQPVVETKAEEVKEENKEEVKEENKEEVKEENNNNGNNKYNNQKNNNKHNNTFKPVVNPENK